MRWSLEQLDAFVAVSDCGSFSAASRRLMRAQSAVSQAVASLEDDLGVRLFHRNGGRMPRLTEAGSALLAEARAVRQQCDRLQQRADGLEQGEEAVLRLAQDEAMPYQSVLASLESLAGAYPLLEVHIASGAQGDVTRKLLEKRADLGLLFSQGAMPEALERRRLGTIDMVTVCSASHELAQGTTMTLEQLSRHRQLVMAPQEGHYPGGEQISPSVWRADSFYAMAELLVRGLGWAWLPRHVAQYPTYLGHLVEVPSTWSPPALVVELVHRRDVALGPVANWLASRLAEEIGDVR